VRSLALLRRALKGRSMGQSGLVVMTALSLVTPVAADMPPSGATSCSGCHVSARISGAVPDLSGRPAEEIVTAMMEFRQGNRPATVMDRIAKGFSDEEIRAIADWLAAGRDQAAYHTQP